MKFKKLGFETKEGLSLANFQDGWSMEYGEGGSYSVDVMHNGKKIANVIEEGNGGPVMISYEEKDHKNADDAILTFLSRTNDDFKDLAAMPSYLKTDDVIYASMISTLLKHHDFVKTAKKQFKQGYKLVSIIDEGWQYRYISSMVDDEARLMNIVKGKDYVNADTKITMLRADSDFAI